MVLQWLKIDAQPEHIYILGGILFHGRDELIKKLCTNILLC